MKMVMKEQTYTRKVPTYITEDGKIFEDFWQAKKHELEALQPRTIWRRKFFMRTMEKTVTIYYLKSKEDFDYIAITELDDQVDEGTYDEEGFYLAIKYDGGDYADTYSLLPLHIYTNDLSCDLDEIKHLTSEKIMV